MVSFSSILPILNLSVHPWVTGLSYFSSAQLVYNIVSAVTSLTDVLVSRINVNLVKRCTRHTRALQITPKEHQWAICIIDQILIQVRTKYFITPGKTGKSILELVELPSLVAKCCKLRKI